MIYLTNGEKRSLGVRAKSTALRRIWTGCWKSRNGWASWDRTS
jgi:hypothetical protein